MPAPPFNQYLGIEVAQMADGQATAEITLASHHTNNRGVAHGGVVSSLLDSAMGAAVISAIPAEWWCATTALSVQFLAGAHEGRLVATGRVLRKGKSLAFVQGEARDERGTLVATAQGTWHLWPFRPEIGAAPDRAHVVEKGSGRRIPVEKILAVGRNYSDHNKEMGHAKPVLPVMFLKPPSSLVADGGIVRLPRGLGSIHHEVELVVVIGSRGRAIPAERALDHVRGYAVGIDLTLRDLQADAKSKGEPWDLAKGFDSAAPVSLVVPKEAVGNPGALSLALSVNGQVRQEDTTARMINRVEDLVAYVSRWITLDPGDLLFTGTPAGVGPVVPGDVLEARLSDLVSLKVTAVEDV